jgi:23S rRNA (uracil1939-C5)-methyltransferase
MSTKTVSVHGIGTGGVGVGALDDGKVVFLPRTAPGDQVRIRIVKEKTRWAQGEVLELLEEGPGRRKAPCTRYDSCDGCSLQHLDYDKQLHWKGSLVGEALRRIGGLEIPDPEVVPSPAEFNYRNKVTFTLRRLPGGKIIAGFREFGSRGRVLDLGKECLLPVEPLVETWESLRNGWGPNADLLPAGRELRLTLREGVSGVGLLIKGGQGAGKPDDLLVGVSGLSSIWREEKGGAVRHMAGETALTVRVAGETREMGGGVFVQVNEHAGAALQAHVLSEAGELDGKRVIDAYCGFGSWGRAMAAKGADVVGIDIIPLGDLDDEGENTGRFSMVTGRVEKELGQLLPANLVVLNPPRGGLDPAIPPLLNEQVADAILYVSCDPATLARDLGRLSSSYSIEGIRAFDLFPQTGHVETVVSLRSMSEPGKNQ